ncbi:MAG: proline dehydrogenase family protein [Flavobacteriales bacterium]|nr:proline dehydrogenase family protein [Flavobacteriales bacterium]
MPQVADTPQRPSTLPNLNDTRTAFAHRSDRDLWQAEQLFRVIGSPALNLVGQRLSQAALALHLPISGLIKATIFRQFCGGETIGESLRSATQLAERGVNTILDHSVEGKEDDAALDESCQEIIRTVEAARTHAHIPFSVFKPSGICPVPLLEKVSKGGALSAADTHEWDLVQERVERICSTAAGAGVPVLIDAEESWLQPAIDSLVERMMERHNRDRAIVFNTLQLYRHDRLAFLHSALERARDKGYQLGVKLVRGAYMEKERELAAKERRPSPIHETKNAVDGDYDAALRFCVDHLDRMAVMAGTHNETSSLLLARLLDERGIARNHGRVWFAQLLGMSDHISFNLAAAGYNVAKYVPYGPVREVLPYLIRRAAENTSVAGQTGRELKLIRQERRRRLGT